ncbi:MAG TPA: hypothetical protein VFV76_14380 [Actinomycetes bacterium]|nr:hypothetical protein [Actinomycetes bacterium]
MADWQDTVMGKVGERTRKKGSRGPAPYPGAFSHDLTPLHFHCGVQFIRLVDSAARDRGVNRSTWVRRTLAVGIADALVLPVRDVLYHSPAPGPFGGHQFHRGQRDTGEGIEAWCPHPGCDGSHL